MYIACLECEVSKLVNTDACPRPTTAEHDVAVCLNDFSPPAGSTMPHGCWIGLEGGVGEKSFSWVDDSPALAVIDCHSLGIYIVILLSKIS
jgi:hypothetical protein